MKLITSLITTGSDHQLNIKRNQKSFQPLLTATKDQSNMLPSMQLATSTLVTLGSLNAKMETIKFP